MITPVVHIPKATTPSPISVFSATLLQVVQTPIHSMAVSWLHLTSYPSAALLQTHPVPLSASGKNQVGQSPWLAVMGAMKFMKTISCARPTEFITFCIKICTFSLISQQYLASSSEKENLLGVHCIAMQLSSGLKLGVGLVVKENKLLYMP